MHNNYYFLRQLSKSLEKLLQGSVVSECFSQSKDELVIRFEIHSRSFYIKASLLPAFSSVAFPDNFNRARKNSVDLFEKVIGQRVTGIRQFNNERSFAITLSEDLALLFKMHGNRANVLLFAKDDVIALFKNNIVADAKLKLNTLDRTIDWSVDVFKQHQERLHELYFTFGKIVWQHVESTGFGSATIEQRWQSIQQVLQQLENPEFYLTEIKGTPHLSLFKTGEIKKKWNDPIEACNNFYTGYTQTFALKREKDAILSGLHAKILNGKNYLLKTTEKLEGVDGGNNYRVWADLLMANLHTIKPNTQRVTLLNFYNDNEPTEIKLKKELTPQKNAELLYRKSKNQHLEIERLRQTIKLKRRELQELEEKIEQINLVDDLSQIRKLRSEILPEKTHKQGEPLPYHEFEERGFRIWVGKNAQGNDMLTLKLAYKEDLWLHAKDVPGSHVLIKYQAGKKFPKPVIERAAQLAAYNSKRKTETLCPVVYTPKKYVRKRKGDPAGVVIVEREEVIMVEPRLD